MAKKNKEAQFLTELKHSFRAQVEQCFWYKITDVPMGIRNSNSPMRFNVAKPFDVLAILNGVPVAIEAKYQNSFAEFGMGQIRPSQVIGLEAFAAGGGHSYIILNIRIPNECNRVLIFNWQEFKKRDKSIGKKELEQWDFIEGSKGTYPVHQLCAHMEMGL